MSLTSIANREPTFPGLNNAPAPRATLVSPARLVLRWLVFVLVLVNKFSHLSCRYARLAIRWRGEPADLDKRNVQEGCTGDLHHDDQRKWRLREERSENEEESARLCLFPPSSYHHHQRQCHRHHHHHHHHHHLTEDVEEDVKCAPAHLPIQATSLQPAVSSTRMTR